MRFGGETGLKNQIVKGSIYLTLSMQLLLLLSCAHTIKQVNSRKINDTTEKAPGYGQELVLRLDPGPGNPRNSEGDFITLKDGRILFIYSRYTSLSGDDHDPAHLAERFSDDGGKTWSKEDRVVITREGAMNVMSVSLLRLINGDIALFYLRKNSETDCLPVMRISRDEAKTWGEPVLCITDKKGYFVLNNDRVIQLADGKLLLAVALHGSPGTAFTMKGRLWSYSSIDNGLTWKSSEEVPNPEKKILQEPGLVELKNGSIMMFIRTVSGVQYLSYSRNKGRTWSPAEESNINSPLSPASIERIPSTGDLLLVWNNNGGKGINKSDSLKWNKYVASPQGKRTPLNTAISKDEGKTWQNIKTLESDPEGSYCYTAIDFSGKNILLSYCAGNIAKRTHLATNITRLSLDWVYNK